MNKHLALAVVTLFLLASSCIMLAEAFTYSSAQTTGSEVGKPWGFKAETNDPNVVKVRFMWFYGDQATGVLFDTTYDTTPPSPFESSIVPDKPGDWYVIISFLGANDVVLYTDSHVENFRLDLVNIPEVPFLGAAGALIAMLLGLAYFKRPKSFRQTIPKNL